MAPQLVIEGHPLIESDGSFTVDGEEIVFDIVEFVRPKRREVEELDEAYYGGEDRQHVRIEVSFPDPPA